MDANRIRSDIQAQLLALSDRYPDIYGCIDLDRASRQHASLSSGNTEGGPALDEFGAASEGGRGESYIVAQRSIATRSGGITQLVRMIRNGTCADSNIVLDLLGGDGLVHRVTSLSGPDQPTIVTCDASPFMVKAAWDQDIPALLQRADCLIFRTASVGGVLLAYGSHHIHPEQRGSVVEEAFRVLQPGGAFVLHDFQVGTPVERWFTEVVDTYSLTGHDYAHFDAEDVVKLLKKSGFTDVEVRVLDDSFMAWGDTKEQAELQLGQYLVDMYGLAGLVDKYGTEESCRRSFELATEIFWYQDPGGERRHVRADFDAVSSRWSVTMPRDALVGFGRKPATLNEMFAVQAARTPDAVAMVSGERRITYRELDHKTNALARRLRSLGVGPGHVVGMCSGRPEDMLTGLVGIAKSGGAYIPLDADYPAERLSFMLVDSGATVVVTGSGARIAADGITEITLEGDEEADVPRDPASHGVAPGPDDLVYVMYTSGSAGRPKGVEIRHKNLLALAYGLRADGLPDLVWAPGASSVLTTSTSFDGSMKAVVLLLHGVAVHTLDRDTRRDPTAIARYLRSQPASSLICTPAMLWALIGEGAFAEATGRPVHVMVGGEAIDGQLWNRLRAMEGVSATNHYGPTECTVNASVGAVADDHAHLGSPVGSTQLYVLDDKLAQVTDGGTGELYIGGPGVSSGYRNRAVLTAERFVPDPFGPVGSRLYRTGDLVRYGENGRLEYIGRTDDQIQVRGYRIELGEIESVLRQHPLVAMAAVRARKDHSGDTQLVAYVTRAGNQQPTADSLRGWLARYLPGHMVPYPIIVLDQMPLTPSGKVDRHKLPTSPGFEHAPTDHGDLDGKPRTSCEASIAIMWAQALRVPRVGVHDNFFEMGGHSLLATQVISRVRDEFGVELTMGAFFEAPTVAGMAERIGSARPASPRITGRR